ncbi:B3 domain-containing transcription factor VRN1-like [Arachis ipaensis]|uniref:B3 domain-containing transcription factor VRN1-like n=1 Tax=Arachis ipaensis TaxID=130454 RepID=UPI000A2B5590|nr:B3 domain-containing transcription factor VRN1-like [Arachis ipaensis]XP_025662020.1 B3 domain-containing transcription factor VRN1-like [Arachis hypogaea]
MASKLYKDASNGDEATTKPVHFFKILLPRTILDGKIVSKSIMMIPRKFVREYGERLSNKVVLKLPNGTKWEVYLEKHDGRIWLQNGWKEFVEHHSLRFGDLLVFRFDGTSHFNVFICDMSATEIDYPFKNKYGKRANTSDEELLPRKTKRTNANNKDGGKLKNPREGKMSNDLLSKTKPSGFGKFETTEVAKNTSFTVMIKPNRGLYRMWLPMGFLKDYIKPGKQTVTLLVGERSSKVRLIYYQKHSTSCLTAGWTRFARESDLEIGDACSFELLASDCEDIVMKVSIFKHSTTEP